MYGHGSARPEASADPCSYDDPPPPKPDFMPWEDRIRSECHRRDDRGPPPRGHERPRWHAHQPFKRHVRSRPCLPMRNRRSITVPTPAPDPSVEEIDARRRSAAIGQSDAIAGAGRIPMHHRRGSTHRRKICSRSALNETAIEWAATLRERADDSSCQIKRWFGTKSLAANLHKFLQSKRIVFDGLAGL